MHIQVIESIIEQTDFRLIQTALEVIDEGREIYLFVVLR